MRKDEIEIEGRWKKLENEHEKAMREQKSSIKTGECLRGGEGGEGGGEGGDRGLAYT
jgi:hypothetical protein